MKGLILTCGGYRGIIILGILYVIFQKEDIKNYKIFTGSSVGGLICALLVEGYSVESILVFIIKLLDSEDKNLKTKFEITMSEIFKNKTFIDYEKENKYLLLTTYSVNTFEKILYSSKSHPNKLIWEAVVETCNLPDILNDIENEDLYDGALCTPIPIASTKKFIKNYNLDIDSCTIIFTLWEIKKPAIDVKNILFKTTSFLDIMYNNLVEHELSNVNVEKDIVYKLPTISKIKGHIKSSDAINMFIQSIIYAINLKENKC